MKRSFAAVAALLIFMILYVPTAKAVLSTSGVGVTRLAAGLVTVEVPGHASAAGYARKKLIIRSGSRQTVYTLPPSFRTGSFPLTFGNGAYRVTLYERNGRGSYRKLLTDRVELSLKDGDTVYLQSIQPIRWTPGMAAVRKAAELTADARSDADKVDAVYRYLVERMRYDFGKPAAKLPPEYTPDVDETFRTKLGICYDTAALFAAMLRSSGVPVRLVKGYAPDVKEYHAWNEVYLADRGGWVTMDVTSDAQYVRADVDVSPFKDASLYKTSSAF